MNVSDLYLPLKHAHLSLVAISISLFIIRGALKLSNSKRVMAKWLKVAPHIIDTLLLISGICLALLIHQYPISHHWLTVKIMLLVGYIVFGMKAMKSTQPMQQRSYFAGALCCVLFMVTVASTHHPLGLFSLL
ncbi:regulator SirB [Bermanella sp. 47_1433_sub80_T6]|nr:regulator SirB [Bermanella sp. 47_1433_sub80_T6]